MRHKNLFSAVFCLSLLVALSVGSLAAAPWDKSERIEYNVKKYDLKKVKTFTGVVTKIYEKVPSFGKRYNNALGFHVVVESEGKVYDVHIGPTWYYKSMEGLLAVGDQVEVLGTLKADSAKPDEFDVRAGEIRKGGEVAVKVRDAEGRPVWGGFVDPDE